VLTGTRLSEIKIKDTIEDMMHINNIWCILTIKTPQYAINDILITI
jgi:hypothetical protein